MSKGVAPESTHRPPSSSLPDPLSDSPAAAQPDCGGTREEAAPLDNGIVMVAVSNQLLLLLVSQEGLPADVTRLGGTLSVDQRVEGILRRVKTAFSTVSRDIRMHLQFT